MPSLESLHQQFKNASFVVIAINIRESKDTVLNKVNEFGLTYDNLLDPNGQVSASYGVNSLPTKYLISPEGRIVGTALGYREWNSDRFKSLIKLLINQKGK